jgi:hypothetical protein
MTELMTSKAVTTSGGGGSSGTPPRSSRHRRGGRPDRHQADSTPLARGSGNGKPHGAPMRGGSATLARGGMECLDDAKWFGGGGSMERGDSAAAGADGAIGVGWFPLCLGSHC